MEEGNYLMMDPACELNEKDTREKYDENEALEEGTSPPLDLDPNEIIEADEETLTYAEKTERTLSRERCPRTSNQIYPLHLYNANKT